jgi:hypothetical protein
MFQTRGGYNRDYNQEDNRSANNSFSRNANFNAGNSNPNELDDDEYYTRSIPNNAYNRNNLRNFTETNEPEEYEQNVSMSRNYVEPGTNINADEDYRLRSNLDQEYDQQDNNNYNEDNENNDEDNEDEETAQESYNVRKNELLNDADDREYFDDKERNNRNLADEPNEENEETDRQNQLMNKEKERQLKAKIDEDNKFYFQKKIKNSGFWGKVRLRRGTWMVIVGLFLMAIALAVISVFWRWWYGPEVNIPCRTVGITLLTVGFFSVLLGLLSNALMVNEPMSKHFFGSPPRWSSWLLIASIVAIVVASVLITIYYTYWHNRFVNTPMIIISLTFYFFGFISFAFSLFYNFKQMNIAIARSKGIHLMKKKKIRRNNLPQGLYLADENNYEETLNESDYDPERPLPRNPILDAYVDRNRDLDREREELSVSDYQTPTNANVIYNNPLNTSLQNQSFTNSDASGQKKDFRKKMVRLKPRNMTGSTPIPLEE